MFQPGNPYNFLDSASLASISVYSSIGDFIKMLPQEVL